MKKVIVVGGGASGIMAALIAASNGKDVCLIEKNDKLGKKLFITGKGRCNITSSLDMEDIIKNIPTNRNFLYSAFYTFSNTDLINFVESLGVKLKIEHGNRVFPQSDKSNDIIKALEKELKRNKVNILLNTKVQDIILSDGIIKGVICNNEEYFCDSLIIATGGLSYPLTGSTGDGYEFAKKAKHTITNLRPSLIPLVSSDIWIKELQGLSLKNVSIKVKANGKDIYTDFGEMLFTHYGLSGPIILSASRYIVDRLNQNIKIEINLKPALSVEQLDKRVQKDFEKYNKKILRNSLNDLLPSKLIPIIIDLSQIDPQKEVNQITKEERYKLIKVIRELTVNINATRPISEAIITYGGISVKEINPSTMESKLTKGLFFTGEILDVDGLTGGYNLQIAFSTGYCAGLYC